MDMLFFAAAEDIINLLIFLLVVVGGGILQLIKFAYEKNKAKNGPKADQEAPHQEMPTPARQNRPPIRSRDSDVLDAVIVQETKQQPRKKKTSTTTTPVATTLASSTLSSSLEATPIVSKLTHGATAASSSESGGFPLAAEIQQMLSNPQSIRQAIILSEILNRKEY